MIRIATLYISSGLYLMACGDYNPDAQSAQAHLPALKLQGMWILWDKVPGESSALNPGVTIEIHPAGNGKGLELSYIEGGSSTRYSDLKVNCDSPAICKLLKGNAEETLFIFRIVHKTRMIVVSSPSFPLPLDPNEPGKLQGEAPLIRPMAEFRRQVDG